MTEMVLVSCSKTKQDGTHRSEDLYEPSDIFQKRRRFRKGERVHWGVLSAMHGYLPPWQAIEDYEKHISDRSPVWGAFVLDDLLADLEYYDVDQVTILAGKQYVDPLVVELEGHGYDVVDFNRGLRPGERKRALKKANAPGEQAELITDGGQPRSTGNELHECPLCGSEADDVSWQTANHQEVCGNDECPINTWDPTVEWIEFDCKDCGEHISRPPHQMDSPGLTPVRCSTCALDRMAEP